MTERAEARQAPPVPTPFQEPRARVGGRWIGFFGVAWLGVWMAQLAPIQLLLPVQVENQIVSGWWVDSVVAFGVVSGISGVFVLVVYPVTGALSDRTTSRFGRRRPWILGGALLFALSLLMLGVQSSLVGVTVFWSLALIGFCVLTAGLTAVISDQVPVSQRGFVSGFISAPQAVGTILGIALVTFVFVGTFLGYAAIAVLLLVLVIPFLVVMPDSVLPAAAREPLTLGRLIAGFWISPRRYPDFGFTLLSRVLVNFGNAFGTSLLFYFLEFGLGQGAGAEDSLLLLTAVYMVFLIAASLVFGRMSDRLGTRKAFVFAASALQAVACLLIALVPEFAITMVGAALLGLGYGCFLSVDQALATQVLPDPHTRGKDLGIMNIASAFPQAVAPLIGAGVVAAFGGFPALFLLAGVTTILGSLAVLPIRSVR